MFEDIVKMNPNKLRGIIYMLLGVISYSSVAIVVKVALNNDVDVFTLLAYRFLFAMLIQWTYALLRGKAKSIPYNILIRVAIVGIIGHACTSILYFSSLELITAILVSLLFATYPAWTMIFEKLLHGVPFTFSRLSGLIAIFMGTVFLVVQPGEAIAIDLNIGIILAVGNAILLALYLVLSRSQLSRFSPESLSPYYATSAFLFFLVIKPPWSLSTLDFPPIGLVAALHFAIFGGFIGAILFLKGLKNIDATEAALIGGFEPVLTIILAHIVLNEELYGWQWISMILILVGVIISQTEIRLFKRPVY